MRQSVRSAFMMVRFPDDSYDEGMAKLFSGVTQASLFPFLKLICILILAASTLALATSRATAAAECPVYSAPNCGDGKKISMIADKNKCLKPVCQTSETKCPTYVPLSCGREEARIIQDQNGCPKPACTKPMCPEYTAPPCAPEDNVGLGRDEQGCTVQFCQPRASVECPAPRTAVCAKGEEKKRVVQGNGCEQDLCVKANASCLPLEVKACGFGQRAAAESRNGCAEGVCKLAATSCPASAPVTCDRPGETRITIEDQVGCKKAVCRKVGLACVGEPAPTCGPNERLTKFDKGNGCHASSCVANNVQCPTLERPTCDDVVMKRETNGCLRATCLTSADATQPKSGRSKKPSKSPSIK